MVHAMDPNRPARNQIHEKEEDAMMTDWHMERELSFAMSLHHRLGGNSMARMLQSEELCNLVCKMAKTPVLCVIGGKDHQSNDSISAVECYEPDSQRWFKLPPMPFPRRGLAAAALDDRVYIVGGQYCGQYTPPSGTAPIFCRYHPNAMVQSFSDKLGDWRNEAPLPTARSYLAATALKGQLYALGGFDGTLGNRYLATVEKYCPLMDTWVSCSPLPSERSHLASAAYGNSIYVFGGYCSGAAVSYVDVYDVVTDEWKRGPCMPTARDSLAAAVLNGKFFALGGCTSGGVTSLASVESFDHRSGKWETETPMPTTRALLGAAVLNGRIFVVGGTTAYNCLNSVHSFDARMGAWQEETPMQSSRIGVAVAVI
uniref:Uncharacterized protein n=2 Tax=Guillardia theta TaxID=55529 RepID=A0A7S4NPE7_GUITH|mmetsp:Transcript_28578/g.92198  ORF Transcript_28578/g.92198 Transcript_28578/m.92198 type:complete len:371 (+) Transcript_28578:100-1212(+)